MPYLAEPPKENPSAYFVMDRSNAEDITRLDQQDTMLTKGLGTFPEQPDPLRFKRVLDIGCGTGGWLRETAKAYPTIDRLFGADINGNILDYARVKAANEHLTDRIKFQAMDVLRVIEFPNGWFDLVNLRLGTSWLRTWDWKKFLVECRRVCRPGGTI